MHFFLILFFYQDAASLILFIYHSYHFYVDELNAKNCIPCGASSNNTITYPLGIEDFLVCSIIHSLNLVLCSSKLLQEGLKVGKDLRVEQSFEDLEAKFEAGKKFSFDAVVQLQ
jgi:hypothetical protein